MPLSNKEVLKPLGRLFWSDLALPRQHAQLRCHRCDDVSCNQGFLHFGIAVSRDRKGVHERQDRVPLIGSQQLHQ